MLASHKMSKYVTEISIESIALRSIHHINLDTENVKLTVKANAGNGQTGKCYVIATLVEGNIIITEQIGDLCDFPERVSVKYYVHGSEDPLWISEFKLPEGNIEVYRWIGILVYEKVS